MKENYESNKLEIKAAAILAGLSLITTCIVYFVCGEYILSKWNLFSGSVILSLFTMTSYFALTILNKKEVATWISTICIIAVEFPLIYPGLKELDIYNSSRVGIAMLLLGIVHSMFGILLRKHITDSIKIQNRNF